MVKGKRGLARKRRQKRVREKIVGTAARPRLNVFRSLNHIYAQIIDDSVGNTLAAASTLEPEFKKSASYGGNSEAAQEIGKLIAQRALEKGVKTVVFDRGGNIYHGRVKALADAAREAGLEF